MFDFFINHHVAFLSGLKTSLLLTASGLLLGIVFAALSTWAIQSQKPWYALPVQSINHFLRSTPFLVQIYLLYYGLPQFSWIHSGPLWAFFESPTLCAILALALNSSAYTTVLLHGAIRAIPKGEIEAAESLGFSKSQLFFWIQLKRVLLNSWAAYTNEIILIFKATSIASTITVLDLMGVTRQLMSDTYQTTECLAIAGILYLLTTYLLSVFLFAIKRRYITAK
ncbi:MAG: Octopine transport system permease protein OccM [Pseudomonadota bacterium]|jgi:arginine transport system permease protein